MGYRVQLSGESAVYHVMSRIVGGEYLLGDSEKEVFRKMLWQVADFCGVEILTYCILSNHFHILIRVPEPQVLMDGELLRRFRVLYPKPTKYQTASFADIERRLKLCDESAEVIRRQLIGRMFDLSSFMKTLKQRFSIWYNRNHGGRLGTLWSERYKSVLVEGRGNPLQTVAAYIDLNPVRAGLVKDPKDYRFCGYAEAVAGHTLCRRGLLRVWSDWCSDSKAKGDSLKSVASERHEQEAAALSAHRMLLFGKGASPWRYNGSTIDRETAARLMNEDEGKVSVAAALHCRVRYLTEGVILGSAIFVQAFFESRRLAMGYQYPLKAQAMKGADWGDLAVIQRLRRGIFG